MRRILLVDDDLSICKALQLGLSSKEVEVDVANSGKSGVELGSRKHYDVIIADMVLPEGDGLDVIKKIKTHSPHIVSVIITGSPETNVLTESARYGVTAYLEKPVSMNTIKEAVDRGLMERAATPDSIQASNTNTVGSCHCEERSEGHASTSSCFDTDLRLAGGR